MPSVTDTMVPTLRASVTPLKLSIRCLIRSLISVALIAICGPVALVNLEKRACGLGAPAVFRILSSQLVSNAVEPGAYGTVDHEVSSTEDGASQQRRVGLTLQPYLPFEAALQSGGKSFLLTLLQRCGGGDGDVNHTFGFVLQLIE